jgi:hypothetical protein
VRYSEGLEGAGVWIAEGMEIVGVRLEGDEDVDGGADAERVSPWRA